jgi:hypothetical protein
MLKYMHTIQLCIYLTAQASANKNAVQTAVCCLLLLQQTLQKMHYYQVKKPIMRRV